MEAQKKICPTACGRIFCRTSKLKVPIIWVVGAPGSGKSTQCQLFAKQYGFTLLSTKNLLRDEVVTGTEKGMQLVDTLDKGKIVSNIVIIELLWNAMVKVEAKSKGYLIEGFPREKDIGELFEREIKPVDVIINLEVAEDTLVKRLLEQAKKYGKLDETTIKERIKTFKDSNEKLKTKYLTKIKTINADGSIEITQKEVDKYINPLVVKN